MPRTTATTRRPRPQQRLAMGLVLVAAGAALLAGCASPDPSADAAPDGLLALVADGGDTTLTGWSAGGAKGVPIRLPNGDITWISAGRADVLAATTAAGKTATSDPLHIGKPLAWRTVNAKDPTGKPPDGDLYFATWDPEGGRFATLAGDLLSTDPVRVVLVDPSLSTAFEIDVNRSVVAAPPAWIGDDRLVIVTGDAAAPTSAIVDTTTGEVTDGPTGARQIAASVNARRVATMAGQGAPVVVRDAAGWLAGDGSSIASIEPPDGTTTAISFALDAGGQRLAVAWAADDGSVRLAVHDGRSDWRRVAQPAIGKARGAVVGWLR